MRATARYWIVLFVAGLLIPSLHNASLHPQAAVRAVFPFLSQATADIQGGRMLAALFTISPPVSAAQHDLAPLVRLTSLFETPAAPTAATSRLASSRAGTAQAEPKSVTAESRSAGNASSRVSGKTPLVIRVQSGQTLWSLASAYGTSVDAIAAANNLADADRLRIGQRLVIPSGGRVSSVPKSVVAARTTTLVLRPGQTLWSVSRAYGVSVDQIVALNGLSSADYVRAGQRLSVPLTSSTVSVPRSATETIRALPKVASSAVRAIAEAFIWPARGVLTSRFGWRWRRHHDGIDISAPRGSPIGAARVGVVVFAGWYYGYGRTVMVDHGNGVRTIYGHASAILVRVGQQVSAGQLIARVGSTGNATGPHLHFEVRINGQPVNPLKYL